MTIQHSVPATVLMRSVLYTGLVGGDGLFPLPFPRCVREPAVNVAGTEVIVTLIVIILVLALVAGFLGYQWRMQIDRTNSATSMIKQVNSERRAMHATATEEQAAGGDEARRGRAAVPLVTGRPSRRHGWWHCRQWCKAAHDEE